MASTLSGRGKRNRRRRIFFPRLTLISVIFLTIAGGLFIRELIVFSQEEDRLALDIVIGGVDVGGLTTEQAQAALEAAYARPVVLYYGNSPILLDPAEIGWRLNVPTMLANASSISQQEGNFWRRFLNHLSQQELQQSAELPLLADYQASLLDQLLRDIAARYDRTSDTASFDVATLTTFVGESGTVLELETARSLIDTALRNPVNRTVSLPTGGTVSGRPSMDTLRALIIEFLNSNGFLYDGQTTTASIFIMDLNTGEEIDILGNVAYSAASTIKVPIMVEYFQRLNQEPSQDEAYVMANSLLCSENSSTNLLLEIIGGQDIYTGLARTNEMLQNLGIQNTYISAPMAVPGLQPGSIAPPSTAANPEFNTEPDPFNQTTAEDMGTLFSMIYDCANYGSGLITAYSEDDFSQRECRQMLELMSANDLQRLLQGGIPEGVRISHKNGWLNNSAIVGDAGIVYPPNGNDYVISVYLWEETTEDLATSVGFERLWPLLEGISRATWNYFSPEQALTSRRSLPQLGQDCREHGYLPPYGEVNLDDINAWRR